MASMSGMKKAVSSIGHTMTHRVGMSQAGLYITAKDISNDSVWTRTFATSGVIARARSLNRKFQGDRCRKGCCELHTLLSDYIHQISGVGQNSLIRFSKYLK